MNSPAESLKVFPVGTSSVCSELCVAFLFVFVMEPEGHWIHLLCAVTSLLCDSFLPDGMLSMNHAEEEEPSAQL